MNSINHLKPHMAASAKIHRDTTPMENNDKRHDDHNTHTNTCTGTCSNGQQCGNNHLSEAEATLHGEVEEVLHEEISHLQDQIDELYKILTTLQSFVYRHRHQIGASIFSDKGVD